MDNHANTVAMVIEALIILVPAVVTIIKLTGWGQAHKDALDEVVSAVGQARRLQAPATEVLEFMSDKEKFVADGTIAAWKAAVGRRDPK